MPFVGQPYHKNNSSSSSFIKIRKLSQVIEKIVAAFPRALHELLYYRNLEAKKVPGLKNSKDNYESYVKVSFESK